ncbi:hypothetical protein ANO11243_044600 [Dothideomycetidae sp. 11243]|nr:hypothetical protein ANO11243_044600 [fungal sp. No.11243]
MAARAAPAPGSVVEHDGDNVTDERSPLLARVPSQQAVNDDFKSDAPRISRPRAAICVLAFAVLITLQATNISILTVTQSAIAADLDAFEKSSWFTSAYLIAASSAGPINGKLAQVLTPRISLVISSILLGIGTLVTAFANGFTTFVVGRAITGVGVSGMFIVAIVVVLETASPEKRGLLIGLLNTTFTVGVSVGATVAGALLPLTGWRPLFWMQAPLGLSFGLALFLALPKDYFSSKSKSSDKSMLQGLARQDYAGALMLTISIVFILLAFSSPTSIPIFPIVVSVLAFGIFVIIEVRFAKEPIIPVSLLKSRGLLFTALGTLGSMMARWSLLFYAPVYAIAVRGWSPATGGAILIPTNLGFALGGILAGWLHIRSHASFYWPSVAIFLTFPVTLLVISSTSTATSSPVLLVVMMVLNGMLTGASLNYSFAHVLYLTPKSTHYMVTSILATFRGFSGSFASAVGGGYFVRVLRESLTQQFADLHLVREDLVRKLLGSPALVRQLAGVEKEVAISGYTVALSKLWLAAAALAFAFAFVQAGTGWKAAPEEEEADAED